MDEIRKIALDVINEALDEWGFDDTPGFATFTDGITRLVKALEESNEFEFYTITKKGAE